MSIRFLRSRFILACVFASVLLPNTTQATIHIVQVGMGGNSFVPSALNVCVNDTIRFLWASGFHTVTSTSVPGGANSFNQQLNSGGVTTFQYVPTVPGTYQYICSFHGGMVGNFNAAAAPAAPTPSNSGPVCEGTNLNLFASGTPNSTYSWSGPNGFTSNTQNPILTNTVAAMSGTYSVVAIQLGCTSSVSNTAVLVNPTPAAPTAGNSSACEGADLNLTASTVPNANYAWTGPNSFASTDQNPVITNASTAMDGTYNVVAIANGCTSTVGSTTVTVNPTPASPTPTMTGTACEGNDLDLMASTIPNATGYFWSGPNGFTNTNQNFSLTGVTTANSGPYSIVAIAGTCTSGVSSITVTVNPLPNPVVQQSGQDITTDTFDSYQWSDANGDIAGATNQTYTPTANGDYTVTVMDQNGCEATSTPFTVNFVVGAQDRTMALAFSVYPNPASGAVTVSAAGNSPCTYSLVDATGRTLRAGASTQPQFSVSLEGIPAGVYLLHISNAAGLGGVQRVVVQ